MGLIPFGVKYPVSRSFNKAFDNTQVVLQEENDAGYGYWLIKSNNPDYNELGKCIFELHANHEDKDISDRFIEMLDRELNGTLSISTEDGDADELLIIWRTMPRDYYLEDMKTCIKASWKFLTAFEEGKYQQSVNNNKWQ